MIFIAGGAGYIGSHTNKSLSKKGYKTVVFDNLVRGHRDFVKWGEFVAGDLEDKEQIRQCFRKYLPNAVMHFSSFAYVDESVRNPARYYENNVVNTINLLEVMREFGINHFIFSSSCATYGVPEEMPITENHPQKPINPYGRTKLMVEEILKDYDAAYGLKHINLRYFNAAGADPEGELGERHDPEPHLIPLAIFASLGLRDDIKIFGTDYPTRDGSCIRDYIHVTDLADAHIKALEFLKKENRSDSFNLGNSRGYTVREVINTVMKLSGTNFSVIETSRRTGDPVELIGSSEKARTVFGWNPKFWEIDTIIETALRWHKRDIKNSL